VTQHTVGQQARPFKKIVCIGLDGATFDVIDPMIAKGKLPTLARLLSTGVRSNLTSTIPPLSAPAWVSFMTGLNPGRHGVFHFKVMQQGVLGTGLVGSWSYRHRTIFDRARRAGLRVVAFLVPMTYPPWPINGVMVSGFPTPDPRTTYSDPGGVGDRLGPLFKLGAPAGVVAGVEALVENYDWHIRRSSEAVVGLLQRENPDLLCYVNSVTDWMSHKFWKYSDPSAPGYEPYEVEDGKLIEHFYSRSDAAIHDVLEAVDGEALLIVLSDHGMGPRSTHQFNTNAWLESLGLLRRPSNWQARGAILSMLESVRRVVPGKTAFKQWLWAKVPALRPVMRRSAGVLRGYGGPIDWSATRAYRAPMHNLVEGVNVNLSGRESKGWVSKDDFERTRQAIMQAAEELVDPSTGNKVLDVVHRREDVYDGEYSHLAPDVILVLNPAYEFGPGASRLVFNRVDPTKLKRSSANHHPHGILALAGPGVRQGVDLCGARLTDVPATILWALGLEVPSDVEGRVLTEAFDDELVARFPVRRGHVDTEEVSAGAYSEEEERQLEAHLADLGYL
jgi:predicted AlkP superfamily phosphohydrolase/phosphomutase